MRCRCHQPPRWPGRFAQIRANDPDLVPGRVARVDGISTFVHASSSDYRAASKLARFAHENELEIEPAQPTVGDWVLVRPGPNRDSGTIEFVLPRSSLLVRKCATRGAKIGTDQILAANIDTAFVVQSTTYFNAGRLERELALVWASGSTPVVVLTKSDLLEDGGKIIIATPDYRRFLWRIAEFFTPYKDEHISKFNKRNLEAICLKHGLRPVKHKYIATCDLIEMFEKR